MTEQLKLIDVDTTPKTIPPRPDGDTGDILAHVAAALCKKLEFEVPDPEMDLDEAEDEDRYGEYEDILQVLDDEYDWDGYKLAKALDYKGWDVDAEITLTLDSAVVIKYDAVDRAVRAWVQEYELKPKYSLEDRVSITYADPDKRGQRKKGEGKIVRVDASRLVYTVEVAELGHRPEGGKNGVVGFCVDEEKILGLVVGT